MSLSREEIKEALGKMPVVEIVQLVNELEEAWGVSAAAPVAVAAAGVADDGAPAVEEQTEFVVHLEGVGKNKVSVIKVVRALTSLGLKESKDLVESAPVDLKAGLSKEDAEAAKKQLEEAGAQVAIK